LSKKLDKIWSPTDEFAEAFILRPIANVVVAILRPTSVSANAVTIVGGTLGIASGIAIALGTTDSFFAAGVLMFIYMVLDCADGQLARLRKSSSHIGWFLDAGADYFSAFAQHVGLLYLMMNRPELSFIQALALVGATGFCLSYRNIFFEGYKALYNDRPVASYPVSKVSPWMQWFVRNYVSMQDKVMGNQQKPTSAFLRGLGLFGGPVASRTALLIACFLSPFDDLTFYYYIGFGLVVANLYSLPFRLSRFAQKRRKNTK